MGKSILPALAGILTSIGANTCVAQVTPAASPTPSITTTLTAPVPDDKSTPAITVDLQNPALLEAIKQIKEAEGYAATTQGKQPANFAVIATSGFFSALTQEILADRQEHNTAYTPFASDILPRMDAQTKNDYILGATQYQVTVRSDQGKALKTEIIGALVPAAPYIHVEYGAHSKFGDHFQIPVHAYIAEATFAVPISQNGKSTGQYVVIMPMRDATFRDMTDSAAAYGDYVVSELVRIKLGIQDLRKSNKDAKPPESGDAVQDGLEAYTEGNFLFGLDAAQLKTVFGQIKPVSCDRSLTLTQISKIDVNGKPYVIGLGTETTESGNNLVPPLRMAVGIHNAMTILHEGMVADSLRSVTIQNVRDGDANKSDMFEFVRHPITIKQIRERLGMAK